jgi:peptidoglycan/LPS O-acetylase OafA/YrhL
MNRSEPPSSATGPRFRLGRGRAALRADSGAVPSAARVPELDALRGLACLVILIYHFKPRAMPFGWAAVDMFFVLSGYLITGIILKYRDSRGFLLNFYARRGLRIWPIYYLTVLAIAALGPILPKPTHQAGLPYYLTYTQNIQLYWSGRVPDFSPYLSHLWTLAIEEQFYIIWPALLCLVGVKRVVPLALALAATSVVARARGYDSWLLLARADGFALGGVLAALLAGRTATVVGKRNLSRGFRLLAVASFAYVAVVIARGELPTFGRPPKGAALSVLGLNAMFMAIVGLVVLNAGKSGLRWLRNRRLCRIGTISYGLYMYHFVVLMLVGDIAHALGRRGKPFWMDVLMMAMTFILARLSWRYVEEPLLNLKDRFAYPGSREGLIPPPIAPASHAVERV